MFGTNPIAKARTTEDGFMVHSIFYTLQGEGPFAGMPALFVRFAGCNLRCGWCDTEFDRGAEHYELGRLRVAIAAALEKQPCSLVVLTGGEPMLQPLAGLIDWGSGIQWQIETAGSVWPTDGLSTFAVTLEELGRRLTIVCSPKTAGMPDVFRQTGGLPIYWKYILRCADDLSPDDGLPLSATQRGVTRPTIIARPWDTRLHRDRIFVQACDEGDATLNAANLRLTAQIAMKYGYRLSVQMHKLAGID